MLDAKEAFNDDMSLPSALSASLLVSASMVFSWPCSRVVSGVLGSSGAVGALCGDPTDWVLVPSSAAILINGAGGRIRGALPTS